MLDPADVNSSPSYHDTQAASQQLLAEASSPRRSPAAAITASAVLGASLLNHARTLERPPAMARPGQLKPAQARLEKPGKLARASLSSFVPEGRRKVRGEKLYEIEPSPEKKRPQSLPAGASLEEDTVPETSQANEGDELLAIGDAAAVQQVETEDMEIENAALSPAAPLQKQPVSLSKKSRGRPRKSGESVVSAVSSEVNTAMTVPLDEPFRNGDIPSSPPVVSSHEPSTTKKPRGRPRKSGEYAPSPVSDAEKPTTHDTTAGSNPKRRPRPGPDQLELHPAPPAKKQRRLNGPTMVSPEEGWFEEDLRAPRPPAQIVARPGTPPPEVRIPIRASRSRTSRAHADAQAQEQEHSATALIAAEGGRRAKRAARLRAARRGGDAGEGSRRRVAAGEDGEEVVRVVLPRGLREPGPEDTGAVSKSELRRRKMAAREDVDDIIEEVVRPVGLPEPQSGGVGTASKRERPRRQLAARDDVDDIVEEADPESEATDGDHADAGAEDRRRLERIEEGRERDGAERGDDPDGDQEADSAEQSGEQSDEGSNGDPGTDLAVQTTNSLIDRLPLPDARPGRCSTRLGRAIQRLCDSSQTILHQPTTTCPLATITQCSTDLLAALRSIDTQIRPERRVVFKRDVYAHLFRSLTLVLKAMATALRALTGDIARSLPAMQIICDYTAALLRLKDTLDEWKVSVPAAPGDRLIRGVEIAPLRLLEKTLRARLAALQHDESQRRARAARMQDQQRRDQQRDEQRKAAQDRALRRRRWLALHVARMLAEPDPARRPALRFVEPPDAAAAETDANGAVFERVALLRERCGPPPAPPGLVGGREARVWTEVQETVLLDALLGGVSLEDIFKTHCGARGALRAFSVTDFAEKLAWVRAGWGMLAQRHGWEVPEWVRAIPVLPLDDSTPPVFPTPPAPEPEFVFWLPRTREQSWADEKQDEVDAEEAAWQAILAESGLPFRVEVDDSDGSEEEVELRIDGSDAGDEAEKGIHDGVDEGHVVHDDTAETVSTDEYPATSTDSWDDYIDSISGGFDRVRVTPETRFLSGASAGRLSYSQVASAVDEMPVIPAVSQTSPKTPEKSNKSSDSQFRTEKKALKEAEPAAAHRSSEVSTQSSSGAADHAGHEQEPPTPAAVISPTDEALESAATTKTRIDTQSEELSQAVAAVKGVQTTLSSPLESDVESTAAGTDSPGVLADPHTETQSAVSDLAKETVKVMEKLVASAKEEHAGVQLADGSTLHTDLYASTKNAPSPALDGEATRPTAVAGNTIAARQSNDLETGAQGPKPSPSATREIIADLIADDASITTSQSDRGESLVPEPLLEPVPVREKKHKLSGAQRRKAAKAAAAAASKTPRKMRGAFTSDAFTSDELRVTFTRNRFEVLTDYPDSPPASPSLSSPTLDVFCLSPRMISWADERQNEVDAEEAARGILGVVDDVQRGWRSVLTEPVRERAAAPDVVTFKNELCDGADSGSVVRGEETADESIDDGFVVDGDIFDEDVFGGHIFGGIFGGIFDDDVVDGSIVEGNVHVGVGILDGDDIPAETTHASATNSKHVVPVPDSWNEYMDSISGGFKPLHLVAETQAPKNTLTDGLSYAKAASAGLNTNTNGFLVLQETNGVAAPQFEDSPSSDTSFERLTKPKKKSGAQRRKEKKMEDATSFEPAIAPDDRAETQNKEILETITVLEDVESTPLLPPLKSDVEPTTTGRVEFLKITTSAKCGNDQSSVTEISNKTANDLVVSINEEEEVVQTTEYQDSKQCADSVSETNSEVAIDIANVVDKIFEEVVDKFAKEVVREQAEIGEEKIIAEPVTVCIKKHKLSGAQRRKAAKASHASKASGDIPV
ncbi:hypothetical protein C7974DRAFT_453965 [Boeremia exigua]|uniref:uncharacterized protein n=1 Tax=Boeremia exigua TaxID=749465 RepID=UPI001E8E8419|nr:uncharacterized protein C7974DRAFT_453965 [Boeremia exigua]KAH6629301.1 hypothetical protein C7974DRAFT_453965 [Boeremia exigua]